MGDDRNCNKGFEDPFHKDPCIEVRQIVMLYDELYQLMTGYDR